MKAPAVAPAGALISLACLPGAAPLCGAPPAIRCLPSGPRFGISRRVPGPIRTSVIRCRPRLDLDTRASLDPDLDLDVDLDLVLDLVLALRASAPMTVQGSTSPATWTRSRSRSRVSRQGDDHAVLMCQHAPKAGPEPRSS